MTKALLSTTYFGPVQWYQKIHRHGLCLIEQHENFQKQTYRNRCIIATANGTQALTVPVIHQPIPTPDSSAKSSAPPITSLLISDHGNWRHLHWNALCSAYGDSPFFEFYADDIQPFFFERRWETLFEFNLDIIHTLCELLDIHPNLQLTDSYIFSTSPILAGLPTETRIPAQSLHSRPAFQYRTRSNLLPVDMHIHHHCGRVLPSILCILNRLTDSISTTRHKPTRILTDITSIFIGIEFGKDIS